MNTLASKQRKQIIFKDMLLKINKQNKYDGYGYYLVLQMFNAPAGRGAVMFGGDQCRICSSRSIYEECPCEVVVKISHGEEVAPHSKKAKEEMLAAKREREKESRKKIKEDPGRYEEERQKKHERYLKAKENKTIKTIQEMTYREQRIIRKKYRRRKKENQQSIADLVVENTTLSHSEGDKENAKPIQRRNVERRIAGRNKVRRFRENQKIKRKIKNLQRKANYYKKRYQRLLEKNNYSGNETNKEYNSNTADVTPLSKLSESYKELNTYKSKQVFKKILDGQIVKRYKIRTKLSELIKYRKTSNYLSDNITTFDRKSNFKRKNMIHQTHLNIKISYSYFCRLKSFWIKRMRVADRDTTRCVTYTNMELLINGLYLNGIIFGKTAGDVINDICCSTKNENCLLRLCNECKHSEPHFKMFDQNEIRQIKQTKRLAKQLQRVKAKDLQALFLKKLPLFMSHEDRILHQYKVIAKLKETLNSNEILVHCDYKEIQAYHFGGSRQQITLHTVVVYLKGSNGKTVVNSFYTLSESLDHGPSAVWAHLSPILKIYLKKNIDTIHFLSDSPSTQYRNKQMFSFLASYLQTCFPGIKSATWNYHESGHGKGAPDGIGGTCKRNADRIVGEGRDIPNFDELHEIFKKTCPRISFLKIGLDEMNYFGNMIKSKPLLTFRGTMKVHQVVVAEGKLFLRYLSCFSCRRQCLDYDIGCLEYSKSLRTPSYPEFEDDSTTDEDLDTPLSKIALSLPKKELSISEDDDSDTPLSKLMFSLPKTKLSIAEVYSDEEEEAGTERRLT
nr:unnamed protein product [Callosobruchus analis]